MRMRIGLLLLCRKRDELYASKHVSSIPFFDVFNFARSHTGPSLRWAD